MRVKIGVGLLNGSVLQLVLGALDRAVLGLGCVRAHRSHVRTLLDRLSVRHVGVLTQS